MLCRFFCNIRLLWFPGKKSCIIKVKDKELKIHRYWLPGRLLCSIRSNRKWCKRRGSSLECQNCFFVYPIIDSNLKNLLILRLYKDGRSYHRNNVTGSVTRTVRRDTAARIKTGSPINIARTAAWGWRKAKRSARLSNLSSNLCMDFKILDIIISPFLFYSKKSVFRLSSVLKLW